MRMASPRLGHAGTMRFAIDRHAVGGRSRHGSYSLFQDVTSVATPRRRPAPDSGVTAWSVCSTAGIIPTAPNEMMLDIIAIDRTRWRRLIADCYVTRLIFDSRWACHRLASMRLMPGRH